jgi:hypothetical protein
MPRLGGLLSSLGGQNVRGGRRGRKPAMFGLLGAGAAGAAAAVAKRRHGSAPPQPAGETRDVSEAEATSTAANTPAHGPDTAEHGPDTQAAGDERG